MCTDAPPSTPRATVPLVHYVSGAVGNLVNCSFCYRAFLDQRSVGREGAAGLMLQLTYVVVNVIAT